MSVSTSRIVALFGSFSDDQVAKLATAGWVGLMTDHPEERALAAQAADAGLRLVPQPAAWRNLTHPLSQVGTRLNRAGQPEQYNVNAGYVRDHQMVERATAVIVGTGVSSRRLEIIEEAAVEFDRVVRLLTPAPAIIDRATIEAELDAIGFGEPAKTPRRSKK